MKTIVQRVTAAKVTVGEEVISSIGRGLCVLVGITHTDTGKDVEYLSRKLLALRLFEDENGKRWQKSVKDENLEILCISQFTLYHRLKGNKPDFHMAMQGEQAQILYQSFLKRLANGVFGAYMQVHIQNDGPVTVELDSQLLEYKTKSKVEVNQDEIVNENVDK
uniref:D-aminoacyl-tRNA deacylase n=1 Tax=Glossina austeni TaxID=7395 RepID=A0A1A9V143_GLOAU